MTPLFFTESEAQSRMGEQVEAKWDFRRCLRDNRTGGGDKED